MKKILFYIDHRNRGGAQRVMVELANYFAKEPEYDIVFATQMKSSEKAYSLKTNVKEVVLEDRSQVGFFKKQMCRIEMLRSLCQDEKPDIIVSFLIITNLIALIVGKKENIPVLISVRNDPTHDHSKVLHVLMRYLYPRAAGWVFQTEDARMYFKSWIKGESEVILNPISQDVICEIENGKITGENENNIVAVGRLDKQKRHDLLIKAFSEMSKIYTDCKLVIYGDGPLRMELNKLVEDLELQGRVVMPGITEHIVEKIRAAKLFVMSSDYEGMPNALLEAMAIGLPVISTDCPCGGPRMLISHEDNGLLVPVGNEESLKNAMILLLEEKELRENISNNACSVRELCSIDKIGAQWERIINKCI